MQETPLPLLLTPEQAAERLGVRRTKIYELIRAGDLESVKVGRLRRVPADALTDYVESLRKEKKSDA